MNKVKKYSIIIAIIGLLLVLTGVTYSFFNYTRTGLANNFSVGNIHFNTTQDGNISLSNVFPIKGSDLSTDVGNHDSVEITITGSTSYSEGIEYLVTFSEVNNRVNNKDIPLAFKVSEEDIGTSSDDYYNDRGSSTSVYLKDENSIRENKYILVGYIAPDDEIDGRINITAYIDADKIAITDTLEESGPNYRYNTNATSADISACASYLESSGWQVDSGSTYNSFCEGTGTSDGATIIYYIEEDNHWFLYDHSEYLIEHNIIIDTTDYSKGTTNEWVNGRTVFTTSEWSSLNSNGISFKIRVEANEGIWVEEETTPASCFTIGDTRPSYRIKEMTPERLSACIDYFTNNGWSFDYGTTAETYCQGTGIMYNNTFGQELDLDYMDINSQRLLAEQDILEQDGYKTSIKDYDASCGDEVNIPAYMEDLIESYEFNENISQSAISSCVDYIENEMNWTVNTGNGETMLSFCNGTGTMWGQTFQEQLDYGNFSSEQLDFFVQENIIIDNSFITRVKVVSLRGDYDDYNETDIGAFDGKNLTSVKIPNTVRYIGSNSFANNQLKSIDISNNEYIVIDNEAFYNNQIKDFTLPRVTYLGRYGLYRNPVENLTEAGFIKGYPARTFSVNSLRTVTINSELPEGNIYNATVKYCSSRYGMLNDINHIDNLIISDNTTEIGDCSFSSISIDNVSIGNNVGAIGRLAFEGAALTSVTIPNNVMSIGQRAFDNNQLTEVIIGNGIESIDEDAFSKNSGNSNLASIRIDKSCSVIKSMTNYPWIGSSNRTGTTIYGSNNEVCDSW